MLSKYDAWLTDSGEESDSDSGTVSLWLEVPVPSSEDPTEFAEVELRADVYNGRLTDLWHKGRDWTPGCAAADLWERLQDAALEALWDGQAVAVSREQAAEEDKHEATLDGWTE